MCFKHSRQTGLKIWYFNVNDKLRQLAYCIYLFYEGLLAQINELKPALGRRSDNERLVFEDQLACGQVPCRYHVASPSGIALDPVCRQMTVQKLR